MVRMLDGEKMAIRDESVWAIVKSLIATVFSPVRMYATPRSAMNVPTVKTIELMRSQLMTIPCARPKAVAASVAATTAMTRPWEESITARTPATSATDGIDRSNSPQMIVIATASAARPMFTNPSIIA
jgi:hypothetical protein